MPPACLPACRYMVGHWSRGLMLAFFLAQVPMLSAERALSGALGCALLTPGVCPQHFLPACLPARLLACLTVCLPSRQTTCRGTCHQSHPAPQPLPSRACLRGYANLWLAPTNHWPCICPSPPALQAVWPNCARAPARCCHPGQPAAAVPLDFLGSLAPLGGDDRQPPLGDCSCRGCQAETVWLAFPSTCT